MSRQKYSPSIFKGFFIKKSELVSLPDTCYEFGDSPFPLVLKCKWLQSLVVVGEL